MRQEPSRQPLDRAQLGLRTEAVILHLDERPNTDGDAEDLMLIGERPGIDGAGNGTGGLIVPLAGDGLVMETLVSATKPLLDPARRAVHSENARRRFDSKF
jgi:hypothetical protein